MSHGEALGDTRDPRPTRRRTCRTRGFPHSAATTGGFPTRSRGDWHRRGGWRSPRCPHDHPETTSRRPRQRLRLPPGVVLRPARSSAPRHRHGPRLLAPQEVAGGPPRAADGLLRALRPDGLLAVARRWVDAFPPTGKREVDEPRKPEMRELPLGDPSVSNARGRRWARCRVP